MHGTNTIIIFTNNTICPPSRRLKFLIAIYRICVIPTGNSICVDRITYHFETLGNIRTATDSLAPGMRILGFVTESHREWKSRVRQPSKSTLNRPSKIFNGIRSENQKFGMSLTTTRCVATQKSAVLSYFAAYV